MPSRCRERASRRRPGSRAPRGCARRGRAPGSPRPSTRPRPPARGRTPRSGPAGSRGRGRRPRARRSRPVTRGTRLGSSSRAAAVQRAATAASGWKIVEVEPPQDGEVVVSYQAEVRPLGDDGAAAIRARAVPDEVAQAPDRVGGVPVDRLQHRLEGMEVPVDVRDDGDAHSRRTLAKRLAVLAAAAARWVAAAHPPLANRGARTSRCPSLDPARLFLGGRARPDRRLPACVAPALPGRGSAPRCACSRSVVWKARPLAARLQRARARARPDGASSSAWPSCSAIWLSRLPFGAVTLVRRRDYGLCEQGWGGWLSTG